MRGPESGKKNQDAVRSDPAGGLMLGRCGDRTGRMDRDRGISTFQQQWFGITEVRKKNKQELREGDRRQ